MGIKRNNPGCNCCAAEECDGCSTTYPCVIDCGDGTSITTDSIEFTVNFPDSVVKDLGDLGAFKRFYTYTGLSALNGKYILRIVPGSPQCSGNAAGSDLVAITVVEEQCTVDANRCKDSCVHIDTRVLFLGLVYGVMRTGSPGNYRYIAYIDLSDIGNQFIVGGSGELRCSKTNLTRQIYDNVCPGIPQFGDIYGTAEAVRYVEPVIDGSKPNKITVNISGFPDTLILSRGIYNCYNPILSLGLYNACPGAPAFDRHFGRCVVSGLSALINKTFETVSRLSVDGNGACNIVGNETNIITGTLQWAPLGDVFIDSEGRGFYCPGSWQDCGLEHDPDSKFIDITVSVTWSFGDINIQIYSDNIPASPEISVGWFGGILIALERSSTSPLRYNYCRTQSGSVEVVIPTTGFYPPSLDPSRCELIETCGIDTDYTVNYEVIPGFPS
jgi:hypothetical protein